MTKQQQPLLYIVTTTSVPYMYHVPGILGLPAGMPRSFRYLSRYLDPGLMAIPEKEMPQQGCLFLRDNNSARKLCFPIRHFTVLWFERGETVSFLNLLMGPRVSYGAAPVAADGDPSVPKGLDPGSWLLLAEHVKDYRERAQTEPFQSTPPPERPPTGVEPETWKAFLTYESRKQADRKRPSPRTVAVPREGELPIKPWDELRAARDESALLWVEDGVLSKKDRSTEDENLKWRSMLPAFAAMERVNKIPFLFLRAPTSTSRKRAAQPHEIGAGGGLYSHGFPVKPAATYRLRVDEIVPHAFCDDAPTVTPFKLTISKSDSAVRPTTKEIQVDGPYGHYEFSFDLDPSRVGTYALLRLSTDGLVLPASEDAEAGTFAPPEIVVPLIIRRRLLRNLTWGTVSFILIVLFVSGSQWMPKCGIDPKSAAETLIQALLFGLALFSANKAGLGDLASNVGKKV